MVYSIVFTDSGVRPYAVTLITNDGVQPDFEGAQAMQYSHIPKLNTLTIDSKAIVRTRSNVKPPNQSLVVYYYGNPLPRTDTTDLQPEILHGPWTVSTCTRLVRRLNEGSVIIARNQTTFQEIKLFVLPPKSDLSQLLRGCVLEFEKAQEKLSQATKKLQDALLDV
jgi:hypothetical protein